MESGSELRCLALRVETLENDLERVSRSDRRRISHNSRFENWRRYRDNLFPANKY